MSDDIRIAAHPLFRDEPGYVKGETHIEWPRMRNGLPYKEEGESFGHYWQRISTKEAAVLAVSAHAIGLLPQGLFTSYIKSVGDDAPQAPSGRVPFDVVIREDVYDKYGRKCGICGTTDGAFHVDHRQPLSRGGTNELSNLWVLCKPCNLSKGNQTVEEFQERLAERRAAEAES